MTEPAFIQFTGVQKRFGKNQVFADLTLGVRKGETLCLLGGSGSGKSVMLKLIIGLLQTDAGSICFDGQEITDLGEPALLPVRRRISMLFQGGALFDSLSVSENVAYPLRERGGMGDEEIAQVVAQKLALVGLPGIEEMRPSELSGGMQKRVALARAIVADPEVILYDEPTTGLDPINTRRINDLILSIQEKLSVTSVVVTHDLQSAFMVADRLAMLSDKRIAAVLPRDEFRCSQITAIADFVSAMAMGRRPEHSEEPSK
jgi:phospholipid/cholesterol/gamma-HCH transport system ATP-binding protein